MANFTKAFNFRGGFQVDTDVLVVRGQQVGIGSTVPQQALDVNGIVRARGLEVSSLDPVAIQSATVGFLSASLIHSGVTSISNGIITATSPAGVVTYYGDGGRLLNLPTSQWLDVDVGLGFTSIYAQGNVGVDTVDPRFVFQVGGVPYPKAGLNTFQDGVGIETGNIWASGDYRSRGNITASGTITGGQLAGLGSGIQALNADNLGVGSIPSNRYGDEIFTRTVYGNLIGIAQSAQSIVSGAGITFDSASVREIEVIDRLYTPDGKLQVGDDTSNAVGDVDVRKTTGNSHIYSIADQGSGQIFAGRQRPGASNIAYGGFRFGGNILSSPLSLINDLDVVNYDIGNLNHYLHAGNSGVTTGRFQWIYGQSNRILANLDRLGKFELSGNLNTNEPTLQVSGIASITGDTLVGGGLSVTRNSIFEANLDVIGDLTLTGGIGITTDSLELPQTTFSGDIQIGNNPTLAEGVAISTAGIVSISQGLDLYAGPNIEFQITPVGDVIANGIGGTGLEISGTAIVNSIEAQLYSGANGFVNNAVDGARFDELEVQTLSAPDATFTNVLVGGNLQTGALDLPQITIGGIPLVGDGTTLTIGGDVAFGSTVFSSPDVKADQITIGTGNDLTVLTTSPPATDPNAVGFATGPSLSVSTPVRTDAIIGAAICPTENQEIIIGFTTDANSSGTLNPGLVFSVIVGSNSPLEAGEWSGVLPLVKVTP